MIEQTMMAIAAIGIVGILCQWLAWWLKLPAILLLLLAGIVAGPVTGLLNPDALFGDLLFPLVSLGVAVILFEGSLTLKFHQIQGLGGVVRNLVTIGALANLLLMAVAAHWLMGFAWELAFLFGAVVTVTGPTVIMPLLRTMRPKADIANILRWEGIIIDPLGAMLAVLVFEFVIVGHGRHAMFLFAQVLLLGSAIGAVAALALGTVMRRHLMPGYLINVGTLVLVLGVFTLANHLVPESGLLAVTVMGMMLTNMKDVPIEDVIDFKESLSIMMISVLFIILAARIEPQHLMALGLNGLALLAAILFIARPVSVALATVRSQLDWRHRLLLGWVAPRGIVAAAVSALFSLRLEAEGYAGAELLVPLTFMVIIGTVVLQSVTARPLANLLGLSEPEPRGVLIVGASRGARAVAAALKENGFRVRLASTNWAEIRTARMEGLDTYFGNVVSEHADRSLDLVGIGRLLAMSQRPALNSLACMRYRSEFGADAVYALKTAEEKGASEKIAIARPYTCPHLFGEEVTLSMLASLLSKGAEIHTTQLTDSFDMDAYRKRHRNRAIPLFALTRTGELRVFAVGWEPEPEAGWCVIGLIPGEILALLKSESESLMEKAREAKPEPGDEEAGEAT